MKKWRNELQVLLSGFSCKRIPALRRSKRKDYLFATDFPQAASDILEVSVFLESAHESGWQTNMENGWIHLSRAPVFGGIDGKIHPGPEGSCCLSLLKRHPERKKHSDGYTERRLLKAQEEGDEAYERLCGCLHSEWSGLLRQHIPLPDIDHRFFGGDEKI